MRTHTFVELEVSQSTYDEISSKLKAAGYGRAFVDGAIYMHGLALVADELRPTVSIQMGPPKTYEDGLQDGFGAGLRRGLAGRP